MKADIERKVSLDEKLKCVLPQAHSIASPSGTAVWHRFKELKKVRDRLVHMKSIDRKSTGPEHQTIWSLLIEVRKTNFPRVAFETIGAYPSLVKDRRWYREAAEIVSV